MYEAEIKLRIFPSETEIIESRLQNLQFSFIRNSNQTDCYFSSPYHDFASLDEVLRLRLTHSDDNSNQTAFLTYKGQKEMNFSVSRKEIETTVSNPKNLLEIFSHLGFDISFKIFKKRCYYQKDDIFVSIDYIEPIGFFVEIEKMLEDSDKLVETLTELYALAQKLGIPKGRDETKSYLELVFDTQTPN